MQKKKPDPLNATGGPARPPESGKVNLPPLPSIAELTKTSTVDLGIYLENWEFLAAYDTAWVDFYRAELARRKTELQAATDGR